VAISEGDYRLHTNPLDEFEYKIWLELDRCESEFWPYLLLPMWYQEIYFTTPCCSFPKCKIGNKNSIYSHLTESKWYIFFIVIDSTPLLSVLGAKRTESIKTAYKKHQEKCTQKNSVCSEKTELTDFITALMTAVSQVLICANYF
jgi:hypothetical protein